MKVTREKQKQKDTHRYLTFRGIMLVLLFVVVIPITLVTSAGIVAIILGRSTVSLVTGILVTSLAAAVFTGVFIILLLLRRGLRLAREQEAFLSNVTHELRTPLTAIRMYAQTLRMGRIEDPKKVEDCLDTILAEASRLERLIDRVLQWRRIAEGKQVYMLSPGRILPSVEDALERFKAMVAMRDMSLLVDVDRSCTEVALDQNAVADVVLNLLYNAYKYTGENKQITVKALDVDGGVELTVTDNGIGIASDAKPRIFERFFRVDRRLTGATSGSGLGLAIVKHVMDSHGGTVEVESEEGQGSRFRLFFPGRIDNTDETSM